LYMAVYVPRFAHDVFISYAHANNEALISGEDGWVSNFDKDLTHHLTTELGRKDYFSVFRDNSVLRPHDDFANKLDKAALNSAVLVAISSQSYVESEWCRRELAEFSNQKAAAFGLQLGERYRVFRVDLEKVDKPHAEIPEFFYNRMLGQPFYEMEDDVEQPYRRTKPDNDDQRYWKSIRRLARHIAELLRQMKETVQPQVSVTARKTVYMAETADDLEEQRIAVKSALEQQDRARSALTSQGIRVVPEYPLSLGDPGLAASLREAIRSADLAVHLFGQLPGRKPVGETRSIVQLQWDLAAEAARERNLRRIAWLHGELDVKKANDQHRTFLQGLESDTNGTLPAEILRIGIEELREIVLKRLFPPDAAETTPDERLEEIDRLVYLTYLPTDRDGAIQIKETLRKERLDVKLFRYDDRDPLMLARIHSASLEKSDGVVIVYGSDSLWLDRVVEETRTAVKARARKNPVRVVCICDAPPEQKDSPLDIGYEKFIVANCRDGVQPEDLKKFVELVKA